MHKVEIRRPGTNDIDKLHQFFNLVITDTFTKEGIGDKLGDIEEEFEAKKTYLDSDLSSNGEKRYFLVALIDEKMIGTIEYGLASELICKCTDNALKGLNEVGTVFVHPDFQKKGIGNSLLHKMYLTLKSKGIEEFCLDSGYKSAQKIWEKKFGDPDYLLKDYWDNGYHHMIWRIRVDDLLK